MMFGFSRSRCRAAAVAAHRPGMMGAGSMNPSQSSRLLVLVFLLLHIVLASGQVSYNGGYPRSRSRIGNWCEYRVSKQVSCNMRNGTEMYIQRTVSPWCNYQLRTLYGQIPHKDCTKASYRVMFRPKYTIGYRTIETTERRCCPGFYGSDCDKSCLNCSLLNELEQKVNTLMAKPRIHVPVTPSDSNSVTYVNAGYHSAGRTTSIRGPQGPRGPSGPSGQAGQPGTIGQAGQPGSNGQTGEPGAIGPMGPPGPAGPQGLRGLQGPPGQSVQGPLGPQGLAGPAGPPGPPGQVENNGLQITAADIQELLLELDKLKSRVEMLEEFNKIGHIGGGGSESETYFTMSADSSVGELPTVDPETPGSPTTYNLPDIIDSSIGNPNNDIGPPQGNALDGRPNVMVEGSGGGLGLDAGTGLGLDAGTGQRAANSPGPFLPTIMRGDGLLAPYVDTDVTAALSEPTSLSSSTSSSSFDSLDPFIQDPNPIPNPQSQQRRRNGLV